MPDARSATRRCARPSSRGASSLDYRGRWLQEIYDYIAEGNEESAYRTVSAIHERAEILLTFPEIGYRYRERPDIRVLLYGHYRIAYLTTAERGIEILGVFHSALDMPRYLKLGG